jgi:P-type Cu+ transporter
VSNVADAVVAEVDPVCGMKVLPEKAAASVEHAGRTWYFCAQGCKTKFAANPGKYDGSKAASLVSIGPPKTLAAATQYTCPMHPEVLSPKPGVCPKCGMALEPTQPTSAPEHIEYTCPMHPQIVRDGPGSCPICGMALEPRTVTATAANPELISMTRRLWVGVVLTLPLLAVMVSDVLPGHPLQHGLRLFIAA